MPEGSAGTDHLRFIREERPLAAGPRSRSSNRTTYDISSSRMTVSAVWRLLGAF
jgi:hypothetical protein